MASKSKKVRSLVSSDKASRFIQAEAKKLLAEELKRPTGKLFGLRINPQADHETIEALLKLSGRGGDLNRIRVKAMKMYGEEAL